MSTISHVRGMLLEEAILHLLRGSGYSVVEGVGNDPTLENGPAGLKVRGRGGSHQIDAIADYIFNQPFSYPQRLLLEGKCYSQTHPVSLPIIRNFVGVMKDVNEFWVSSGGGLRKRYHYQSAVFSASGYTEDAELYAFAQDVYLIPLAASRFFSPVIDSIRSITSSDFNVGTNENIPNLDLSELRRRVRQSLKYGEDYFNDGLDDDAVEKINTYISECRRIDYALLTVFGGVFPVFLVPNIDFEIGNIFNDIQVRIYWDDDGWYLNDVHGNHLFSFDLPGKLFNLYEENGVLTERAALALKGDFMSNFQVVKAQDNRLRIANFHLDHEWIDRIRSGLRTRATEGR